MRKIKFRGKRLTDGKWIYGDFFRNRGLSFIAADGIVENPLASWHDYNVDPETVGQFTGLCDADGKEIYEGDIIGGSNGSINGYHWPFTRQIKWDDATCGFNTPKWGYMDSTHYYEILGNIHDNPELMED